jgi:hypothetical protein
MKAWIWLVALALQGGEPGERLVFVKEFPQSKPEYIKVALTGEGGVMYQDRADEDQPLKMRVTEAEAAEVFALAAKLGYFDRKLESPLTVAFMGMKTLRYERGNKATESKFNFTEDGDAQKVTDFFERISESAQNYYILERAVRFDKLGVNQALLQLQVLVDKGRVVSKDTFLPLLDRVSKNSSYLNMARERAKQMADAFRGEGSAQ